MGHFIKVFKNALKSPDLKKRILITFGFIVLVRFIGNIPTPGIDRLAFTALIAKFGQLGQMMDLISGGALTSASIAAMGIQPYINSSIIIQLLTVVIPYLQNLQKEGEVGRKKIQKITKYTTVVLALVQSFAFWRATRVANLSNMPVFLNALLIMLTFTAGTALLIWIGELINEKGVGNGISLIIFAGIISRIPSMLVQLYQWQSYFGLVGFILAVIIVLVSLALIIFVIYISLAERRIPVQYAKRVVGRKQYGGHSTYLPIKVNQGGVMPVIFASSLMSLPNLLVTMFFSNSDNWFVNLFRNFGTSPFYYVLQALLIIGFTFFYSMMQYNPIEISNNLQKNGGFIPGIRPGRPTSDYIGGTARKLCWFEGLFLTIITLSPLLIGTILNAPQGLVFGGTALLIVVGVAVDYMNRLESDMMNKSYKGFLD